MEKKLYKDMKNKKLCGVCAGVAKYLNLDPTIVRLGVVILSILGSLGIWAYIIGAIIIPEEPASIEE